MKTKSSFFAGYTLKLLAVAACFILGSSGFSKCEAQAIVGKWKGVSVKNYYSAEFAKQMGKSVDEKFAKDLGISSINYDANHTFVMTFSAPNSTDVITMKGEWSLSGDQLKSTLEPKYNPQKMTTATTIVFNGNTMVGTTIMPPPNRIVKSITILARM
jgi:Lipocalin-like domain